MLPELFQISQMTVTQINTEWNERVGFTNIMITVINKSHTQKCTQQIRKPKQAYTLGHTHSSRSPWTLCMCACFLDTAWQGAVSFHHNTVLSCGCSQKAYTKGLYSNDAWTESSKVQCVNMKWNMSSAGERLPSYSSAVPKKSKRTVGANITQVLFSLSSSFSKIFTGINMLQSLTQVVGSQEK